MTVTSTDPIQDPAVETAETLTNNVPDAAAEMAADQADFGTDEDLGIPDDIPTADDPSSRAANRDMDNAGFTLDEFAALLSKYDYNFKPGDIVNGTVFALESKGAMIDIGAKPRPSCPSRGLDQSGRRLGDVLFGRFESSSSRRRRTVSSHSPSAESSTSVPGNGFASFRKKTPRSIPRCLPPTAVVHWSVLKVCVASSRDRTSAPASPRKNWLLTSYL